MPALQARNEAIEAGVDGILGTVPYYNKPPQHALYAHFEAIARNVDLPIILYNVPSRTATNMSAETTIRLSQISNIIGIKDAGGKAQGSRTVIVKDLQTHQIKRVPSHIDFLEVSPDKPVAMKIPFEITGKSKAAADGGKTTLVTRTVTVPSHSFMAIRSMATRPRSIGWPSMLAIVWLGVRTWRKSATTLPRSRWLDRGARCSRRDCGRPRRCACRSAPRANRR